MLCCVIVILGFWTILGVFGIFGFGVLVYRFPYLWVCFLGGFVFVTACVGGLMLQWFGGLFALLGLVGVLGFGPVWIGDRLAVGGFGLYFGFGIWVCYR